MTSIMDILTVIVGAVVSIPVYYGLNTVNPNGGSDLTQGLHLTMNDVIMLVGSGLLTLFGGKISGILSKVGMGAFIATVGLTVLRNYPTGSNTQGGAITTPQPAGM